MSAKMESITLLIRDNDLAQLDALREIICGPHYRPDLDDLASRVFSEGLIKLLQEAKK